MTTEPLDPRYEGCLCQACARRYRGDLMVPGWVWELIRSGLNLLCPTCILDRVIDRRIWDGALAVDIDTDLGKLGFEITEVV